MKPVQAILLSLVLPMTRLAQAHPGHGMGEGHGNEVLHPFLGPEPLLLIAAVGAVFVVMRRALSRKSSDRDEE